jgi:hypothetical protein
MEAFMPNLLNDVTLGPASLAGPIQRNSPVLVLRHALTTSEPLGSIKMAREKMIAPALRRRNFPRRHSKRKQRGHSYKRR